MKAFYWRISLRVRSRVPAPVTSQQALCDLTALSATFAGCPRSRTARARAAPWDRGAACRGEPDRFVACKGFGTSDSSTPSALRNPPPPSAISLRVGWAAPRITHPTSVLRRPQARSRPVPRTARLPGHDCSTPARAPDAQRGPQRTEGQQRAAHASQCAAGGGSARRVSKPDRDVALGTQLEMSPRVAFSQE
jgi:hypothetical protein